ncbi:inositol monophosphatase [Planctomycetaceae bacterium]|jgi:myo-inositol-1(or 4)-monophosphatase|nr:inositol monophosphatase [Planctomycetaceae bacterium]MDG2388726.1 inositol monophosphatase family protein [Planctomycetaceae bacterium]
MEFQHAADVAEQAAREGGRILEEWAQKFTVSEKSRSNLVTEADFASQQAIHQFLKNAFPTHGFLGEEGLSSEGEDPDYRWIIDPLDGTGNYVHRFPYYGVSIALEYQSTMVVGIVFDPNREELFRAVKDAGATMNGEKIAVSQNKSLSESMLMASLPVASDASNPAVTRFLNVIPHAQSVQRSGSAALNLSNVAAGRLDGFWSTSLKPWDMAAGILLVTEAGGTVTTVDGSPFVVDDANLLATNGLSLHTEVQQYLV